MEAGNIFVTIRYSHLKKKTGDEPGRSEGYSTFLSLSYPGPLLNQWPVFQDLRQPRNAS